jgi:hypothetical protein
MIYHHINLVCLPEIKIKPNNGELFFVDSLSLQVIAFFLGFKKPRVPGSRHVENIRKNQQVSLFLTPRRLQLNNQIILPQFRSDDEIVNLNWLGLVGPRISKGEVRNCYLGISSPKQNLIAQILNDFFPNVNFYCVGAVLDDRILRDSSPVTYFRDMNIEFAFQLVNNPRRSLVKLRSIIFVILRISFIREYRDEMRSRISMLAENDLEI